MATAASNPTQTAAGARAFLNSDRVRSLLIYLLIAVVVVILAFPFYYLATTAFKPTDEIFEYPPTLWPRTFTLDHFGLAFQAAPFPRMLVNTLVIAILAVIGALFSNSLAAYAIARLRFPLKGFIFACMLVTLMIPGWISLVPSFIFWRDIGRFTTSVFGINIGVNTIGPLVIRHFLTSAFAIFLMRQFFLTIPKELEEAARIDGASYFKIYWRIFLPLSFPVMAVIGITTFMFVWNDLLGPLIYLSKPENQTIMVGLSYLNSQHFGVTYRGARFAGALMAAIPVLLLYFVANKYLIRGIVLGGIK
jgi:ABC-type glycerol-3-phosphate transport system permease component